MSKGSTIIFKQSYKSRTAAGTAGLNVRHLAYIATRPGAVYNKGCGFGLWGQLPGDGSIRIQSDLLRAKNAVREASADHTLYRAIISVGKEDAQQHGLYDRGRWEQLVNDHIGVIAKEMEIKPQDLCWCASMHYSRGHPHVHILYWDSSDQPRPEGIPKNQFAEKAERIRAEFAGDIHREEIRGLQQEQREEIKALRTAIQAMCREANPERGLNLARLYKSGELTGLSKQLDELVRNIPAKGSLRYAYLPKEYKLQVNRLIESCLEVPELRRELERYDRFTGEISTLYANGEKGAAANMEKARDKLTKELGNEIMGVIREIREEIQAVPLKDRSEAGALIQDAVEEILPRLESYHALQELLPAERIPAVRMGYQIPGYFEQMNKVVGDVMLDARVRIRLQSYALETAGVDLSSKPDAPRKLPEKKKDVPKDKNLNQPADTKLTDEGKQPEEKTQHILRGKILEDSEWDSYQEVYREAKRDLRAAITERVRADAGWTEEALHTGTASLLCGLMRCASQAAGQQQAAATQARVTLKNRSKDKSREAKRDYWATQSHAAEWGDGLD